VIRDTFNERSIKMTQILVIEDDRKIAKSLEIRLRAMGYKTMLAYDAVMGIKSAVQNKPDAVIMDIAMPGGDGLTVAESMQELSSTQGTPVIFITASKKISHRERAIELGAAGFFEKPYDTDRLLDKVAQVV